MSEWTVAEVDRFWSKVEKGEQDECWRWAAHLVDGYGRFWLHGRYHYAHRVIYEHQIGPIPNGLVIDHLCRNRACVNPAHLEVVTNAENILRGESISARNAVKTHCPQGHPYSGSNLYVYPSGFRACRKCHSQQTLQAYHRKRADYAKEAEGEA